tara:strand:+ start:329 stop:568 length:240 start_codon:yes stop_codon:yes gene_type:complete
MAKLKKKIVIKNCNYPAMLFCFRKGFRIYPKVFDSKFKVFYVLGGGGKYYMDGKEFTREESFQAVWDLYTKIYEYYKNK